MISANDITFLLDVDNTLLDADRLVEDLKQTLKHAFESDRLAQYWALVESRRTELGYVDYLGALGRYRLKYPRDQHCGQISTFLLDYPFNGLVYAGALDLVKRLRGWGPTVIVSDGDVIFQPRKIERSGLSGAVDGCVLLYIHKERELCDIEREYPARHYVFVDDKPRILAEVKQVWGARVTTVLPRQGHYANDAESVAMYPAPDLTLDRIGDLLDYDLDAIVGATRADSATEAGKRGTL